jgi:hypothetical protein
MINKKVINRLNAMKRVKGFIANQMAPLLEIGYFQISLLRRSTSEISFLKDCGRSQT